MNLHNQIQTNIISYNEISKFCQNNNILALNLQNKNKTQLLFPIMKLAMLHFLEVLRQN